MAVSKADQQDIIATTHALADAARVETLRHFRVPGLIADSKTEDFDPVTVADRASEAAMRDILSARRPDDAILGEEFDSVAGTSGLTWILDPIDGTRGYVSGTPTWGVLIAVADATGPIFGVIDQPYIGERFVGGFGDAFVEGPRGRTDLSVLGGADLAEATLLTTFPEVGSDTERRAFERVAEKVKLVRYGLDCYGYALLAAGQVDLVIEAGLQTYDIAAPIAVVEAAGGIVTDWTGGPAFGGGRAIAASGPEVHARALAILREVAG